MKIVILLAFISMLNTACSGAGTVGNPVADDNTPQTGAPTTPNPMPPGVPPGDSVSFFSGNIISTYGNSMNGYMVSLSREQNDGSRLVLIRNYYEGIVCTGVSKITVGVQDSANFKIYLEESDQSNFIKVKSWTNYESEPPDYQMTCIDSTVNRWRSAASLGNIEHSNLPQFAVDWVVR